MLDEDRVLISADTDFGFLLAASGADRPSVVLFRLRTPRSAARLAATLLANLGGVAADLAAGAIVVLEDERVRVPASPASCIRFATINTLSTGFR